MTDLAALPAMPAKPPDPSQRWSENPVDGAQRLKLIPQQAGPSFPGSRPFYDVDSVRHGIAELTDHWENRLVLHKFDMAEAYVPENLCIILEGKSGTGCCTIDGERFSFTEPRGASVEIGEAASYLSPVTDQYQLGNGWLMDNWGQGGVLVRVVQTVSHIKEVPRAFGEHLK
jgi:hypothetical protein